METIFANWYEYPHLYDIAFSWDATLELDFLERLFARYAAGAVQQIYEPFVGTGRLAIPLAQRGYVVCGVDLAPVAIDYCRARCAAAGAVVALAVGDVTEWRPSAQVDAVVTLIDSFRHLASAPAAAGAVRCFRESVRSGGLLVIGLELGRDADRSQRARPLGNGA